MRRTTSKRLIASPVSPCCWWRWPAVAPTRTTATTMTGGTPGSEGFTAPDLPMLEELGEMEGEVNILAWPGYAEDGTHRQGRGLGDAVRGGRPAARPTSSTSRTSDEAVQLMKTGEYDVVSASGDASLRLIAAGDVAPVNTDLITELRRHLRLPQGPRLELRRRPDVRRPARLGRQPADVATPTTSTPGADQLERRSSTTRRAYAGKVTAYDSPIYIADAALYLMNTQPDLGIEHPYALDEDQLAAAVELLKAQKEHVGGVLVGLPQGGPGLHDR